MDCVFMLPRLARPLGFLILMNCAALAAQAGDIKDYVLGPQDELQIRLYDWRNGTGDEHQWAALTGTFTVGASGNLSLPLIGEVVARGQTVTTLSKTLSQMLQAKIGLAERPNASIEVARFRPFYMIGSVDKPGEYSYRPGLTVLQSVAIAGGVSRAGDVDASALERDVLVNRGEIRVLAVERLRLLVRQARLDAELNGDNAVTLPEEVRARTNDPDVERAVKEETLQFTSGNEAAKVQADILKAARALGLKEVDALDEKAKALASQLEITKKELSLVSGLVSKGLAVVPRQLAIEQSMAQFQNSQLDVELSSLRTQQEIARVDRELAALDSIRRTMALNESREVRTKIRESAERITTASNLVRQAETRLPYVPRQDDTDRVVFRYRITRMAGNVSTTSVVNEADAVEPGDTVRVERQVQVRAADTDN